MNIWQKNNKKFIITLLIQALILVPVFGIDLDYTVDDAIRKNYNVDSGMPISGKVPVQSSVKPVQNLTPVKPTVTKTTSSMPKLPALKTPPATTVQKTYQKSAISRTQVKKKKYIPLRKGMEFDIVNVNPISDKQKVGTNIVFAAKRPIKTAYYTIPQGTKFVGKIVETHNPQITGNGGLVSISVVTIILSGEYQHIDTRITEVGGKKVFFEDIKGKRSYWKNTVDKGKWGRKTFHKMNKLSSSLAKDKTTVILSPFTFIYGAALGGISTITSPVVSVFCKGKNVYIPANTDFKIKFEKDTKVYY